MSRAMIRSLSSAQLATCALLALCATVLRSSDAQAYPWMLRHGYADCRACHYDPSGAGAITPYARVVADSTMTMGERPSDELQSALLFGALDPPSWLDLGGDVRVMALASKMRGLPAAERVIWMQLDGEATVTVGEFVASGTLGYAPEGALGAALTRGVENNVVSRQHWLGYGFADGGLFLRAGRMNLPFGIRSIEHTLWTRKLTRTNINDEQQYGAAAYFAVGPVRGEVMGIAGNLQLRPDDYRERGYSAYVEAEAVDGLVLGVSSLITHRDRDTTTLEETWRHVHGGFARWATPYQPLVLLAEGDHVLESSRNHFHKRGPVGYLQADFEPVQGMHFMLTGEANRLGVRDRRWSYGGWLSYAWFCAPHTDVRLDGIYQSFGSSVGRTGVFTLLLQGHVFL